MKTVNLAINIGSFNTAIYKKGEGVVLREASVVAVDGADKKPAIVAFGNEAERMIDRCKDNISICWPIVNGKIENEDLARKMIGHFIEQVSNPSFFCRVESVVAVDSSLEKNDLDLLRKIILSAGVSSVKFVPSIICSAISLGLDVSAGESCAIINMGAANTEIAVINYCGIINGGVVNIGGNHVTRAIINHVEKYNGLSIGFTTAENIKIDTSTLFPNDTCGSAFFGVALDGSGQREDVFVGTESFRVMQPIYEKIAKAALAIINSCKPAVLTDVVKKGVYITGGACNVSGIRQFFSGILNYNVNVDEDGVNSVITGAGKLLYDYELLKKILEAN